MTVKPQWTEKETKEFERAVLNLKSSNFKWQPVADIVGTKTAKQCSWKFHGMRLKSKEFREKTNYLYGEIQ